MTFFDKIEAAFSLDFSHATKRVIDDIDWVGIRQQKQLYCNGFSCVVVVIAEVAKIVLV